MIAIVRRNGRSGWYLRVLGEGAVEAGQEVRLVEHPNPEWTVRRAAHAMLGRARDPRAGGRALAGCGACRRGGGAGWAEVERR